MNLSPVHNPIPIPTAPAAAPFRPPRFDGLLARFGSAGRPSDAVRGAGTPGTRPAAARPPDRAQESVPDRTIAVREAVQRFVATALITPLLSELRHQPLDSDLFHGGFAEDAFRQQLETFLADRIVQSSRFPIADRIYDAFSHKIGLDPVRTVNRYG